MAEGTDEAPLMEVRIHTASLGPLSCRRVKAGDYGKVAKHLSGSPLPTQLDYARALLSETATKADGTSVQYAEALAVSEDELEPFADGVLRMHSSLRGDWTPGQPAMLALAAGIEGRLKSFSVAGGLGGLAGAGSIAAIQERFPGAASRSAGLFSGGVKVGTATPIAEDLAAVTARIPRPSDTALEIVQERLAAFRAKLSTDREAAMVSVSAPGGPCFFVQSIEALSKEMIALKGSDDDGGPVEVVQHHSQCNIMLVPVRKVAAKGPLGFTGQ
ncbi:hypothetical protein [Methylobacterium sp. WCS2018Hpa-22]|jgi:hypothetical protein|uniref:hypothetical protein n=1 Tax=Methylobacterium sp. WCS2018Hpa-22 TaxID=3073633 RepID=UPI00288A3775|nr:hypothetical protein [Methylobacterium sp. WCS2018Hpa-22]